jgi:hypothetical protein
VDRDRILDVEKLIRLSDTLEACLERLAKYEWDYEVLTATITRDDTDRILQRYISDELASSDVQQWLKPQRLETILYSLL